MKGSICAWQRLKEPDGLSLDATTGIISGIPTLSGTHFVVIRASGQSGDAVAT
ncbi:MAG: putative Ig domain-containing protein, partial [Chthoniobacterales bacterium]|nr:putative Ig domain-containing protein [Chthoniobacterales bacterium]